MLNFKSFFQKSIKYNDISDHAQGLIEAYIKLIKIDRLENEKSESAKKKLITSIRKALSEDKSKGGLSTIHFIITRKQYANAITLYRKLPDGKLANIKKRLDMLTAGQPAEAMDFTYIEKGTHLWGLISTQDVQRYGFYLMLKPEFTDSRWITKIKQNLKKFEKLRNDLGVTNSDTENNDLFKLYFCEIYNDIAEEGATEIETRNKIEKLLRPVSRT